MTVVIDFVHYVCCVLDIQTIKPFILLEIIIGDRMDLIRDRTYLLPEKIAEMTLKDDQGHSR